MGQADLCSLSEIGDRLRAERRRMGLNQAELGALGNVTLQSQSRYEKANTEAGVLYLARVAAHGLDVSWVLTGSRAASRITPAQSDLLDAFDDLRPTDRAVLVRLAAAMAERPQSEDLVAIPSTAALREALGAFLEASPGLAGDELAHELATRLPIILRAAEDEVPASVMEQPELESDIPVDRPVVRQAVRRERRS